MDVNYVDGEEVKVPEAPTVSMQAFFGPDKKYGSCPYCAAVIIVGNKETTALCPNCRTELVLD